MIVSLNNIECNLCFNDIILQSQLIYNFIFKINLLVKWFMGNYSIIEDFHCLEKLIKKYLATVLDKKS